MLLSWPDGVRSLNGAWLSGYTEYSTNYTRAEAIVPLQDDARHITA